MTTEHRSLDETANLVMHGFVLLLSLVASLHPMQIMVPIATNELEDVSWPVTTKASRVLCRAGFPKWPAGPHSSDAGTSATCPGR